jgi:hypothetical protein
MLTSPFLYLAIMVGLYWPYRRADFERTTGAAAAA